MTTATRRKEQTASLSALNSLGERIDLIRAAFDAREAGSNALAWGVLTEEQREALTALTNAATGVLLAFDQRVYFSR